MRLALMRSPPTRAAPARGRRRRGSSRGGGGGSEGEEREACRHTEGQLEHLILERKLTAVDQKIVGWIQYQNRKLDDTAKVVTQDSLTSVIQAMVKPPRREALHQVYSSMFWEEKVKPKATADWEEAKRNVNIVEGEQAPQWIDYAAKTAYHLFSNESAEVKDAVQAEVDSRYEMAMEEYRRSFVDVPQSDRDKKTAMKSAYPGLQPLADALAERFGCYVSIDMTGPSLENEDVIGGLR
ncbi:hypothetical protein EWM64_g1962 [Hericium alpestre]|uniref:Uncharacterized protein n=1 Tax=Hericium alpestre TaxID=135208 RepID=A0A4Z0A7Z4_9AGAM|nr:hypothetical protein EWM64_g1962 [Hericium alpestre]